MSHGPLDLAALRPQESPDVLGTALARFRKRIASVVLLALAVPVVWVGLPFAAVTWWRALNADFNALAPHGQNFAPKHRKDMALISRGELPLGFSWRAYAWKSPSSGSATSPREVCWAVFLSSNEEHPSVGCSGRQDLAAGQALDYELTTPDPSASGFTAVAGAAADQVHRVRVSAVELTRGYRARTARFEGTNIRVFATVVPANHWYLRKAQLEAYTADGRRIPQPPKVDARQLPGVSQQARSAADAAVRAAGDPSARVTSIGDARTYANVAQSAPDVGLTIDPAALVYRVNLEGTFTRRNMWGQEMRPRESAEVTVAGDAARPLSIYFPPEERRPF